MVVYGLPGYPSAHALPLRTHGDNRAGSANAHVRGAVVTGAKIIIRIGILHRSSACPACNTNGIIGH
jgi:hypothetical protein